MLTQLPARVGQYLLVLLVAVALNFALPRALPGSPLATLAGEQVSDLSAEARRELLAQYGLDRPLGVQFRDYLVGFSQGDLGRSLRSGRTVQGEILERLPWTLLLLGSGLVLSTVLGVFLGMRGGAARERRRDTPSLTFFLALDAMPPFWVGMLLILLFGVWLGVLPTFGATSLRSDLGAAAATWQAIRHLVLPLVTVVIAELGQIYLITRYAMLSVMGQEYMLMARAKGLPRRLLLRRHAFRNACLPVHTLVMIELGQLLGGQVVIETVFAYPGLGRLLFESVLARDFPVLQGTFLVLTVTVIGMNLLADLTYPLLDPRVRRAAAVGA